MKHLFDCKLGNRSTAVSAIGSTDEILHLERTSTTPLLWVCDTNTVRYVPSKAAVVVLSPGEEFKGWQGIEQIIAKAMLLGLGRDGKFIAVGGGVVCDMTAFAASIYMRGCSVALVPTTLLSMVDASLGGKTAIDLFGTKNLVGTFHPATEVHICTETLGSLDEKGFRNGLGEVLKHALLSQDESLVDFLENERNALFSGNREVTERMIVDSLQVKRHYVEADPTETKGIRDALNLGHTFGHALETVGNLSRWSHGEAVAWGVVKALRAGVRLGLTPPEFAKRYERLFDAYGFDVSWKIEDAARFLQAMQQDKKKRSSQVRFVLMKGQGVHVLQTVDPSLVRELVG